MHATIKNPRPKNESPVVQEDMDDIRLLMEMHARGFIRWSEKPFTLKSDIESHVYVFGREDLTDNPYFGLLFGKIIAKAINLVADGTRKPIVIGIPTAATSLAAACSFSSYFCQYPLTIGHRVMREKKKGHGAHGSAWVNGAPQPDHQYFTLENVVTSGASLEENLERMAEDGYPVMEMQHIVGVDREQGGVDRLRKKGYQVHPLFTLSGIAQSFVERGHWNEHALQLVEHEVAAHQFR